MAVRILIVEDEPHIIESLSFVLGREGFVVSSVLDGESALETLRREPPDLVILDVMLPKLSGFEVLKVVKSDPALKSIPVIILTAKGQLQDRRLAEEIGSDGFMTKPFSNRDVVDNVRRLIGT
jgi:DNA-binding response OmpR family regulator